MIVILEMVAVFLIALGIFYIAVHLGMGTVKESG